MSTIGTQLNWGSSYLVTDLYKRFFVRKAATEKKTVADQQDFTFFWSRQRLHGDQVGSINSGLAAWS